jgi:hypothetical protein
MICGVMYIEDTRGELWYIWVTDDIFMVHMGD